MIDPKSLRIGNTIWADWLNKPVEVEEIQYMDDNVPYKKELGEYAINQFKSDLFSGVPLSENELIRLGFNSGLLECGIYKHGDGSYSLFERFEGTTTYHRSRKYVHEIQNQYYELYGEELTYKTSES